MDTTIPHDLVTAHGDCCAWMQKCLGRHYSHLVGAPFLALWTVFSLYGHSLIKSLTIESSLMSGHGLGHKSIRTQWLKVALAEVSSVRSRQK